MSSIWRASTPTQTFRFGFDPLDWDVILVTYKQGDTIVLEKDQDDLTIDGNTASFVLTQAEANLLDPSLPVAIQVRVATNNGASFPSRVWYVDVDDVLNDTVLPETQQEQL